MRRPADNPFRASAIESLAFRAEGIDTAGVVEQFEIKGRRGAIVGPHGSGKTTLLCEMATLYRERGYEVIERRLGSSRPRLDEVDWRRIEGDGAEGCALMLDSAGWLSFGDRRRLARAVGVVGVVVVTAHRRTFVPTVIDTTPSEALLLRLLRDLVGDDAQAWRHEAQAAFENRAGDIRAVWRDLYDRWLTRPSVEAKA